MVGPDIIIFIGIGAIFLVGLVAGVVGPTRPASRWRAFVAAAPSLMIGVGVFGTFLGIALALLAFDVNAIDASVPLLLAGMKVAFLSSVVGMGASLLFRFCAFGFRREEIAATDPLAALNAIREATDRQAEAMRKQTEAIAGDGDASLSSQMAKLRLETRDEQERLRQTVDGRAAEQIEEFRVFAKHMTENNQKALIEALEGVIRDFNEKLTEQFGENFKQLNAAVGRLVDWQENYRTQMDRMEAQLASTLTRTQEARSALEESAAAMGKVSEHAGAVETLAGRLDDAVATALTTIGAMHELTQSIAALRGQAIEAFPVIERNLEKVTTAMYGASDRTAQKLTEGADQHVKLVSEALKREQDYLNKTMQDAGEQLTELSEKLSSEVTRSGQHVAEATERAGKAFQQSAEDYTATLKTTSTDLAENLQTTIENQTDALEAALNAAHEKAMRGSASRDEAMRDAFLDASKKLNEGTEGLGKGIDDRFAQFDEQSQQAVTRVIEGMGGKLGAISEKLSGDYGLIIDAVDKLKRNGRAH